MGYTLLLAYKALGTGSINVFNCTDDDRRIFMIDTPGFNDTTRSDTEVLGTLAAYLGASYANGVRINGVIILHPITDNRMSGSGKRTVDIIRAICGFTTYDNVAIATTKWPATPSPTEAGILESREAELKFNEDFFGDLVSGGAEMFRYSQARAGYCDIEVASAQDIVSHLIQQSDIHTTPVLQLQREIVDQNLAISHTTAGEMVNTELASARRAHERELRQLEVQMQSFRSQADALHRKELRQLRSLLVAKLDKFGADRKILSKTMQDLHEEEQRLWQARLKSLEEELSSQLTNKEQELRDMEASLHSIREDVARRRINYCETKLAASEDKEYEQIVAKVRQETGAASRSLKTLRGQAGNIINGGTNGLVAGIASGAIAAAASSGLLLCTVM
ncbi:hypothetical protein MY11210_004938 [Beauveria gryllotalpidicola]